jgi:hypothetical protein
MCGGTLVHSSFWNFFPLSSITPVDDAVWFVSYERKEVWAETRTDLSSRVGLSKVDDSLHMSYDW